MLAAAVLVNKDLHPEHGPRKRVASIEEALVQVRRLHPQARMKGSIGPECSFWVGSHLVVHAWPVNARAVADDLWLRLSRS